MTAELKVPEVGESIAEVQIGEWLIAENGYVEQDEVVVIIDTDKASVELVAPISGRVTKILKQTGDSAQVGELIGTMEAAEAPPNSNGGGAAPVTAAASGTPAEASAPTESAPASSSTSPRVMPAAQRLMHEQGLTAQEVTATGPGGRILKEDVIAASRSSDAALTATGDDYEQVVPMSTLRRRIAERLVSAQQTAALLTTFNEIDMTAVIDLRKEYKESFLQRHGVKLGFMSFFVKASVDALKQCPAINSEIRDQNLVYKNHYDIGVAVGGGKGLVVPVLRGADRMSFAEIEIAIGDFATRAQANKITLEELTGGTFTISNGGVYGSLLSTPIVNPPQSAILGLHAINQRPAAVNGEVLIRPMMYVAVTYDHRVVDGREAVTFLKRIKEAIENPSRMLLEV